MSCHDVKASEEIYMSSRAGVLVRGVVIHRTRVQSEMRCYVPVVSEHVTDV